MYGFHKIKTNNNKHEFKHPKFVYGNLEEIRNIKRKSAEVTDINDTFKGNYKAVITEYTKLKKSYTELEESLNIIVSQNKRLVETNKDLVIQLYLSRKESELRIKKLIFLFFVLMENYTPDLANMIKNSLVKTNLLTENEINITNNPADFKNLINKLAYKLLNAKGKHDSFIDNLLNLFSNNLDTPVMSNDVLLDYRNTINDLFGDHDRNLPIEYDKISVEPDNGQSLNLGYGMNNPPLMLQRDISIPERNSIFDNNSILESDSFNFGSYKDSRRDSIRVDPDQNIQSEKNEDDNEVNGFISSEVQSIHNLFSPKSEKEGAFDF